VIRLAAFPDETLFGKTVALDFEDHSIFFFAANGQRVALSSDGADARRVIR
jgi:multiple sugar transport system ATP-binding protein